MTAVVDNKGVDDYSLSRVPKTARYSWVTVALQRFGQVASFHQFLLGAVLGFGMTFWQAVLAITLGSVMLEVITILLGIAGVREGLPVAVLTRWCGFGRKGSALVGLLVAMSLAGWFGVQNAIFAQGLEELVGGPPEWVWAVAGGLAVTLIVIYGFKAMARVAYVTVPAFLLLAFYSIGSSLSEHSLGELVSSAAPGPPMSLAQGVTLVSGAFILGALMTPDMTRFNRTPADVVKQTVVSVTLGQYLVGLAGVLLAHAAQSNDVVQLITSNSGVLGMLILVTSILKINDWNLYSSALGLVNAVDVLFGKRVHRGLMTLGLGVVGTAASLAGILGGFEQFLTAVGVAAPPVAGIIIAEYFVVHRWHRLLDAHTGDGALPDGGPDWVPASLIAWAGGAAVGATVDFGFPAINSVLVAFLLYVVIGRLGRDRSMTESVGRKREMRR